jgi:acyl dehydratase
VVLFFDRKYAKTLHFLAEPVHLDAAWAEPSAIGGTLIQEIVHGKWTGEVAVLYRSADSAQLRNTLNHRTMR